MSYISVDFDESKRCGRELIELSERLRAAAPQYSDFAQRLHTLGSDLIRETHAYEAIDNASLKSFGNDGYSNTVREG